MNVRCDILFLIKFCYIFLNEYPVTPFFFMPLYNSRL